MEESRLRYLFHRDNRELPSEGQLLTFRLAALRLMGVTDRYEICSVLNVGEAEDKSHRVKHLDRLYNIYHMMTYGIPNGMFTELPRPIKCPKCGKEVTVVPCVACRAKGHWPTKLEDVIPVWDD